MTDGRHPRALPRTAAGSTGAHSGIVSDRVLRRTLWQRQHLHERAVPGAALADPIAMTTHLVGLQAQEPLPPYLSLAARIEEFDPLALSAGLADRRLVRLLLQRGTIRLVTPEDAALLRPLVQPHLNKVSRSSGASRPAAHVPRESVRGAGREILEDGPRHVKALGRALAERFPDAPATALANVLREAEPLVQVPPRGLWGQGGPVVYQTLDRWAGTEPHLEPPVEPQVEPPVEPPGEAAGGSGAVDVLRRYLRAYGPASGADFTTWTGITGARALVDALGDEVVDYRTQDGRVVHDLAGLPLADADLPAPARLLGRYDDVWLAHAGRDRVTSPEARARWAGLNGGVGSTVFLDGTLAGLWTLTAAGKIDLELFDAPTRAQVDELADEVERVEALLRTPAASPP